MKENIEAIFPLTPIQRGMLFHSSFDQNQEAYFQQVHCTFEGIADLETISHCWKTLIQRHKALRSVFIWKHQKESMHIVLREVPVNIFYQDWRKDADRSEDRMLDFLEQDRKDTFDLSRLPNMRITLIQQSEGTFELIWSHHHILLDGWSTGMIFSDFKTIYTALVEGSTPEFKPLFDYKTYLNWFKTKNKADARQYWTNYLKGIESTTSVPKDRGGVGNETAAYVHKIDGELYDRLKAFAAQQHVTINTLLLGLWGLLLSKYQTAENVLLGVTVSGRPAELENIENAIGLFINSLPFNINTSSTQVLGKWLRDIQDNLLQLRNYEHTALSEIKEWCDLPSSSPLFESLFVFENYPISGTSDQPFGNIRLQSAEIFERTNYALTALVEPQQTGATVSLLYQTSRIIAEDIEQIAQNYTELLSCVVSANNAEIQVDQLPAVTKSMENKIIYDWNDTDKPFNETVTMHELFEQQCLKSPENTAVVDNDGAISYKETNEHANRIAHTLIENGLQKGDYVGVFFNRNKAMIPALLGILKAGGVYVPMDVNYPNSRLSYILEDLNIQFVLSQSHLVAELEKTGKAKAENIICLGENGNIAQFRAISGNIHNPGLEISSRAFAYVIFTSGTTGKPKGVTVNHRPVSNLIEWIDKEFSINETDRVLLVSSLCFDLSVYDIFGLLSAGGSIRVASDEAIKDPKALLDLLFKEPITFWDSAPAALQQLVAFFPTDPVPSSLRLVFQSGDWIPLNLPGKMKETFPNAQFISLGGATEATVWSNYFHVNEVKSTWKSIPYGRPIQNAYYYVLDANLNVCPIGVPGDLYIGGECLSSLYVNAPELTAKKFIADPFSKKENARMYFTGDKAAFYPDGNIEFLGRIDDQVKVRGYRIELGEIQACLSKHPAIDVAIMSVGDDAGGYKQILAYYTLESGTSVSEEALRNWVLDILPAYMLPAQFIQLENVPITANGKLDRKKLQQMATQVANGNDAENSYKPTNPLEEIIWNNWAKILGSEPANRDANFFEDGGHSLLAIRFIARLGNSLSLEIAVRSIFDHPTLGEFFDYIKGLAEDSKQSVPDWERKEDQVYRPLSYAQERLWFLYQLKPYSTSYNVPLTIKLTGNLDVEALKKAIHLCARKHEIFRTSYQNVDGITRQQIHGEADIPWKILDLSPEDGATEKALEVLKADAETTFDLMHAPLLRSTLIKVEDDKHLFQLTTHHIAVDGWSIGILVRELNQYYNAFTSGSQPQNATLDFQYADFAEWQKEYLESRVLDQQLSYWKNQLENFSELRLPKRQNAEVNEGNNVFRARIESQQTEALKQFSQEQNVTLFMTLLTASNILFRSLSRQDDLVMGTDIAGRSHINTEGMIGFFVNQIVLRNKLSDDMKCKELLSRVRTNTLAAYQNQDVPFEKLVQDLNPPREANKTPFFQVKLVLQNNEVEDLDMKGLSVEPVQLVSDDSKYDILITFEQHDHLDVNIEYKSNLYATSTIQNWWKMLQLILKRMVETTDDTISKFSELIEQNKVPDQMKAKRKEGLSRLKAIGRDRRKPLTVTTNCADENN